MKMTEYQAFALQQVRNSPQGISPNYLAVLWYKHKNGRYPPVASRDRFGATSNAYKCLRKLAANQLIHRKVEKHGSYQAETYYKNK